MSDVPALAAGQGVPSGRCTWDNILTLCDQALAVSANGSAAVSCSDNDCGPRRDGGR